MAYINSRTNVTSSSTSVSVGGGLTGVSIWLVMNSEDSTAANRYIDSATFDGQSMTRAFPTQANGTEQVDIFYLANYASSGTKILTVTYHGTPIALTFGSLYVIAGSTSTPLGNVIYGSGTGNSSSGTLGQVYNGDVILHGVQTYGTPSANSGQTVDYTFQDSSYLNGGKNAHTNVSADAATTTVAWNYTGNSSYAWGSATVKGVGAPVIPAYSKTAFFFS